MSMDGNGTPENVELVDKELETMTDQECREQTLATLDWIEQKIINLTIKVETIKAQIQYIQGNYNSDGSKKLSPEEENAALQKTSGILEVHINRFKQKHILLLQELRSLR